ncbi:MAG: WG repeat-containing protein [Brevinema sp.]
MRYIIFLFVLVGVSDLFAQRLYPFPENGKWGYINQTGQTIVQPIYHSGGQFVEGLAKIVKINERGEYLYGFINSSGKEVIPPKFLSVSDFDGGIARVKIREKFFPLLTNGTLLTDQAFDELQAATNGVAIFRRNERYGYLYTNGRILISERFTEAYPFSDNNLAIVSTNEGRIKEYGMINLRGEFVVEPTFLTVRSFVNGFAAVQDRRRWYVIDDQGRFVSRDGFDAVGEFSDGLINVKQGSFWGYINSAGEMIIAPKFKIADRFSKGLAIVGDGKLYSYINTSGNLVTPYSFTRATRFDGKLARVSQGTKNGFMNTLGRFNLTDKISSIGSFYSGRARMKVGSYYGYYSDDAKLAIKPTYLHASDFKDNLAVVIAPMTGGYQVSYINTSGTTIKSWSVMYQPILKNNDIFYSIIYPTVPFYKDSDPNSRIIIRANYGDSFTKSHQRTATPINGHGLSGLLYFSEYYARPGYIFSEVVSLYAPPKIGIGISAYFRESIGVISDTDSPTAFTGSMNTVFFNGAVLHRQVNRTTVMDSYFIPFMKVSESLFLIVAALGYPISEYPQSSGNLPNFLSNPGNIRFSGRKNNENKPIEYTLTLDRSRVRVVEDRFGVKLDYSYPTPITATAKMKEPVFVSDPRNLEELEKPIVLTNELLEQGYTLSNATHTNIIIEEVTTTNSVDLTDAVINDVLSNNVSIVTPIN